MYEQQTAPLVDYYRQRDLLSELDGSGRIEAVHQRLMDLLSAKALVNARESQFQQTALMWAVGHPDIVRQLLAHGADKAAATKVWKTTTTNYTPVVSTIGNTGIPFTAVSIGMAMANRELLSNLRAMGEVTGGPRPMTQRDRSRFLSALDEAIQKWRRTTK